jgi:lipid II:glycine glycyltransferase (peptidoglycan interpeptide bridge formation enzyme)
VEQEGKCLYEWFACGVDGQWKSIFPSTLATYFGIKYAAEHRCPRFDMMGAGKPDEAYGVRDFKAKFGGELVEHGRFLCITKPMLYKIGTLGVKILKKIK